MWRESLGGRLAFGPNGRVSPVTTAGGPLLRRHGPHQVSATAQHGTEAEDVLAGGVPEEWWPGPHDCPPPQLWFPCSITMADPLLVPGWRGRAAVRSPTAAVFRHSTGGIGGGAWTAVGGGGGEMEHQQGGGSEGGVGWCRRTDFAQVPRARAAQIRCEVQNGTCRDLSRKSVGRVTPTWHHRPEMQNHAPALFGGYIRRKK